MFHLFGNYDRPTDQPTDRHEGHREVTLPPLISTNVSLSPNIPYVIHSSINQDYTIDLEYWNVNLV